MNIEWDEAKRQTNLAKHGLDFRDAPQVLMRKHVVVPSKQEHREVRFLATAHWNGVYVTLVYTMRGDTYRIISFRRARNEEKKRYQDLHV